MTITWINSVKTAFPDNVLLRSDYGKSTIDTPLRLAHFSRNARMKMEFKALEENLNYSADGLRKVFPDIFLMIWRIVMRANSMT